MGEITLAGGLYPAREVARFVGRLVSVEPAVRQVLLFGRLLVFDLIEALRLEAIEQEIEWKCFWEKIPWDAPLIRISEGAKTALR